MNKIVASVGVALLILFVSGCVQMPTKKQGVVDLRPQISFAAPEVRHDARVFVDSAEVGRVGEFIDGVAALRLLPGTHVVKVISGETVLLEERFYVADGVSRSFVLR
jgi:hypothetical protein